MPRSKVAQGFVLLQGSPVRAHLFAAEMVDTANRDFEGFMMKGAILNMECHAYLLRIPHS